MCAEDISPSSSVHFGVPAYEGHNPHNLLVHADVSECQRIMFEWSRRGRGWEGVGTESPLDPVECTRVEGWGTTLLSADGQG